LIFDFGFRLPLGR